MTSSQGVTRMEIADAVGHVFGDQGTTRAEIVEAARIAERQEMVEALQALPNRRYGRLNDLWEDLGDIPVGV